MEITETISLGLEGNAFFRRSKSMQFRNDSRNEEAARLSEQLSKDLSVSPVWGETYGRLMTAVERREKIQQEAVDVESEVFRSIGFSFFPETADDIAERLCNDLSAVVGRPSRRAAAKAAPARA